MTGPVYIMPWFFNAEGDAEAQELTDFLSESAWYFNHRGHTLKGFTWPLPAVPRFVRLNAALRCWTAPDFNAPVAFRFQAGTWLYVREVMGAWYRVDGGWIPAGTWLTLPALAPAAVGQAVQPVIFPRQLLQHRLSAFSKIGDSLTASPFNLTQAARAVVGPYNIKPALDFYAGSFERSSRAAQAGWSVGDLLTGVVEAELKEWRPALALISIGTNDAGARTVEQYRAGLAQVCRLCLSFGTTPVLQTLPSRQDADTAPFSAAVREVAGSLAVPMIDQQGAMDPLSNSGIDSSGVHPSPPANGNAMDFTDLRSGYTVRNWHVLGFLEQVRLGL